MTVADPLIAGTRREDLLISVCFGDLPADPASLDAVVALARSLDARFRFREIVVVAEEARKDKLLPLVKDVENLRLFTVRNGTPFYRCRVIAADEAIGDVVVVANVTELSHLELVPMIEQAADEQTTVLAVQLTGAAERTLASPISLLGRIAGFKVGAKNLQTMAVPRTLLNQLLSHPDPDLALRFPPRNLRLPLSVMEIATGPQIRRKGDLGRRLALLQKLLVYVAPRLLMAVTLTSAMLAAMGLLFAVYVLFAWFAVEDLAPGWLTLSAMLSLTAFFLGISIMGLSLGLQQLLARADRDGFDGVASEINRIDLFGRVASDLNVDLERETVEPPERLSR